MQVRLEGEIRATHFHRRSMSILHCYVNNPRSYVRKESSRLLEIAIVRSLLQIEGGFRSIEI